MAQTFGSLPIGAKFDFDPGKWGLSYHGGPYIKQSSRKYKEINSDKVHTIGSIKAKVIQQNPMRQMPKGKFIPVSAVRLNRNGTISVKVTSATARKLVKNPRAKRRNVEMGYYNATGFHPLRASFDYDPDRASDDYGDFGSGVRGKGKKKKKSKAKARRKR